MVAPESAAERSRVKSRIDPRDPARIPTLEAMARDMDALYRRFPGQLDERIAALEGLGLRLRREAFQGSSDALAMKRHAVACYRYLRPGALRVLV